jgi:hypothetical protein
VPRQLRSSKTSAPPADSQVLRFISRAEQLNLRGSRNYDRYMQVVKGFMDPDSPERAEWQRESAEDVVRDAAWNQRHGALPGGARILQWQHEGERRARQLTSADAKAR